MSRYPLVPLGEAIRLDIDEVAVKETAEYRIAGVFGFGRGLFGRGPISGLDTSYASLNRFHCGQLVLSRLKAFEGAVAIVPQSFDGWFGSQEFPTFTAVEGRAEPSYLTHLCRWPRFWELLQSKSKGVGARRERVHPKSLLQVKIPLPDIGEQQRVASRMEYLCRRIEDAVRLTEHGIALGNVFPTGLAWRLDLDDAAKKAYGWREVKLGEVMQLSRDEHEVDSTGSYPNVGVLSFGRGLFRKPPIDGLLTKATKLYRIRVSQFLYSRLFAFEGAYAEVEERFDGFFVSNEFPTFDLDQERVRSGFLAAYFAYPPLWRELAGSSKGLGLRRQRVHPDRILERRVWLPPLDEQLVIARAVVQLRRVRNAYESRQVGIRALELSILNRAFAGEL